MKEYLIQTEKLIVEAESQGMTEMEITALIEKNIKISRAEFIRKLIAIHFERTSADLSPGQFRAVGNVVEIMPVSEKIIFRVEIEGGEIKDILKIDAITRSILENIEVFFLFPAKHFISTKEQNERAFETIKAELAVQLKKFEKEGKLLEAERLKRRTSYDLALIREMGYCNGIENYSRHFSGKKAGEAPDTLLSYFGPDFLTIIDESHVAVPQIGAMYSGDASRKQALVDYGFRLPSCKDNRPLKFKEFEERVGQVIYTSATPSKYELEKSREAGEQLRRIKVGAPTETSGVVEQVIRPTGLIDPIVEVRPIISSKDYFPKEYSSKLQHTKIYPRRGLGKEGYGGQVADFIAEAEKNIKAGGRVIATTLTKKMAEDLSEYLKEKGIKTEYLHSDIKTIDRIEILTNLRKGPKLGGFDCLVGVNLLREGLDLPEVTLIGILDADKEGFLRSDTSLIQIIGRAARNVLGKVILYADTMTGSMERAIGETNRRREKQIAYNKKHGITPKTIIKKIQDITDQLQSKHQKTVKELLTFDMGTEKNIKALIKYKEKQLNSAAKILDFETAALLRDEILELTKINKGGE